MTAAATITSLSYAHIILYCFGFEGIALITIIFLGLYIYLFGKIKTVVEKVTKTIIERYEIQRIHASGPQEKEAINQLIKTKKEEIRQTKENYKKRLSPNQQAIRDYYIVSNAVNIKTRFIKASYNWFEKITAAVFALMVFLLLTRAFINDETFAYTLLTLFLFVLSNSAAVYISTQWTIDKYIFYPVIYLGERVTFDGIEGEVFNIGNKTFWIKEKKKNTDGYIDIYVHQIPLSKIDYSRLTKHMIIGSGSVDFESSPRGPINNSIVPTINNNGNDLEIQQKLIEPEMVSLRRTGLNTQSKLLFQQKMY